MPRRRTKNSSATGSSKAQNPPRMRSLISQVMSVMVEAYGELPREFWDLSKESDKDAGRTLVVSKTISAMKLKRVIDQKRFRIVKLRTTSNFNKSFDLPDSVEAVEFGRDFDRPLKSLPAELRSLSLGRNYYHPLPPLPNKLVELTLDFHFNQPLGDLPHSLKRLTLGRKFNQSVTLPPGCKNAIFGNGFNTRLDQLPDTLEELNIGDAYLHPLPPIPLSLSMLVIGDKFNHELNIPANANLKKLSLGALFDQDLHLPDGLLTLALGRSFNRHIDLPECLIQLWFDEDSRFNVPVVMPDTPPLSPRSNFQQRVVLPQSLKDALFSSQYGEELDVPEGCNLQYYNE